MSGNSVKVFLRYKLRELYIFYRLYKPYNKCLNKAEYKSATRIVRSNYRKFATHYKGRNILWHVQTWCKIWGVEKSIWCIAQNIPCCRILKTNYDALAFLSDALIIENSLR